MTIIQVTMATLYRNNIRSSIIMRAVILICHVVPTQLRHVLSLRKFHIASSPPNITSLTTPQENKQKCLYKSYTFLWADLLLLFIFKFSIECSRTLS